MKQFIAKLTILTLSIALIGWLIFSLAIPEYYLSVFPFLLIFFYLVTIGIHAYQLNLSKKDMGKFTRSNILVTFFKLVLYSVVAIVYIALHKENAIPFVVCLMLVYLIFTFFEVSEITRISKTEKNS